jgi:two-component system response regulator CpxR
MNRVLMVDDDVELCELVGAYLTREGWSVEAVHDGEAGLARAAEADFAAVILDVMLPGLGGFEVLRRLRAVSQIPVLMLTARGDEVDRVLGLELGADDYLPKPFSSRELAARLRAILRRTQTEEIAPSREREVLRVGDVELDVAARAVHRGDLNIELTSVEFKLLELLMRHAGDVVTREQIAQQVFARRLMPYDRSVDTHLSNLRRKLDPDSSGGERIKTVRGSGYVYTQPPL